MKKLNTSIKVLFTFCFLSLSQILLSQESKLKSNNEDSKLSVKSGNSTNNEPALKARVSTNGTYKSNASQGIDTQGKSFQLDENDQYQGRKEEFLSQITLKELPNDFPKYEKWMGVRHYNELIDDYYKKHLDILIPTVKQKLTEIH